jgi:hypothetical protein
MTPIVNYLNSIKLTIVSHNLYFFIIAIILLQIINNYISIFFPIKIYQVATFLSLFNFINNPFPVYELIIGGIIASFVSIFVYKIFVYLNKQKKTFFLNLITFITVLSFMVLFNCVSMPALAYTLISYKTIPTAPVSYIFSYIVGTIFILIICYILIIVFTFINSKFLHNRKYNLHFNQVKENISNWNVVSTHKTNSNKNSNKNSNFTK